MYTKLFIWDLGAWPLYSNWPLFRVVVNRGSTVLLQQLLYMLVLAMNSHKLRRRYSVSQEILSSVVRLQVTGRVLCIHKGKPTQRYAHTGGGIISEPRSFFCVKGRGLVIKRRGAAKHYNVTRCLIFYPKTMKKVTFVTKGQPNPSLLHKA